MALEGELSEFPLTDIIQLVDLSKKTGGVHIRGQRGVQALEGWIYFRDGKIIGAAMPGQTPLETVYTFFTVTAGPFRFHDDISLETPTISVSNEIIIMEGVMRQDAWAHIQEHVPTLTIVPRLVPNPTTGTSEINLEAEEWRVLTMVNGKNTVAQIAQRGGLGEFRTCEIIVQLLQSGLIEKREAHSNDAVAPEFERITADFCGDQAPGLLQEAWQRAAIADPGFATTEQLLSAVDYLEAGASRVIGPTRARQVAMLLRTRVGELTG